jgi:hypothetical protein
MRVPSTVIGTSVPLPMVVLVVTSAVRYYIRFRCSGTLTSRDEGTESC